MANFPYVNVTKRLAAFFNKIQSLGVPNKPVGNEWLASIGFETENDKRIKGVLKFIDFIDDSNMPTDRWRIYLGGKQRSRRIMAEGIEQGYSDLFEQYPKAHQCSDEDLRSFFKVKSGLSDGTVMFILTTFKDLCSMADFGREDDDTPEDQKEADLAESPPPATEPKEIPESGGEQRSPTFSPKLNINVQIHIPPEATAEQIDKIFESMAKYLFNKDID